MSGIPEGAELGKAALRRAAVVMLRSLAPLARAPRSASITNAFNNLAPLRSAAVVGLFASMDVEPDLAPVAALCMARGQRLVYPRVHRDDAGPFIRLYEVAGPDALVPGWGGLLEPPTERPVQPEDVDVLITPGLLFDRAGGRLGRGGGCYDKLLAMGRPGVVVGVGFHEQIVPRLPLEPHDALLDGIVTDEGFVNRAYRRVDGEVVR